MLKGWAHLSFLHPLQGVADLPGATTSARTDPTANDSTSPQLRAGASLYMQNYRGERPLSAARAGGGTNLTLSAGNPAGSQVPPANPAHAFGPNAIHTFTHRGRFYIMGLQVPGRQLLLHLGEDCMTIQFHFNATHLSRSLLPEAVAQGVVAFSAFVPPWSTAISCPYRLVHPGGPVTPEIHQQVYHTSFEIEDQVRLPLRPA